MSTFARSLSHGMSNIKSKQRIAVSLTSTSQNVTISGVDLTKAIVRISYAFGSDSSILGYIFVQATFSSSTNVVLAVNNYSVAITAVIEVIEFNNVKSLQSGQTSFNGTSSSITVTSIIINKSILFYSLSSSDVAGSGVNVAEVLTHVDLSNTTAITLQQINVRVKNICWSLIEFN